MEGLFRCAISTTWHQKRCQKIRMSEVALNWQAACSVSGC